jgi:hypothetical protein
MGLDKTIKESKLALLISGFVFLILGITLVLVWWADVVSFFRGFIGVLIALGGLLVLYMVKE